MTHVIPLIARVRLEHHGQVIPAGSRFEGTPIEAALLRYQRKADFAPPGVLRAATLLPDPPPADAGSPPEKPRRRYRRRDLQAAP